MDASQNPYEPPAQLPETAWPLPFEAERLVEASRWQRFLAAGVDYAIFGTLTAILRRMDLWPASEASAQHSITGLFDVQPTTQSLKMTVAAGLLWPLVHGVWLHRNGQTIGKRLLHIRVVDVAGNKPNLWTLWGIRHLAVLAALELPYIALVLWLADALAIFGPRRRCLHDYLAGTWVVRAPKSPS